MTIKLSPKIKKTVREFGYLDEEKFIREAIEKRLMELKKFRFFAISEEIRKGLEKKGIKPEDVLREIKS
ncbi:hypothetical protein KAS79_00330 [Candidatus Parcubacteria bacterium]|nr:hypothetical protein [Candidatus Parcubacteria bacterium]